MHQLYFDIIFGMTTGSLCLDALARMMSAVLLSYIVGAERSVKHKVAGIRTHCLLASAGCLAALAGPVIALQTGGSQDQTRLAGQILTGIGFVGAGAIVHRGNITVGVTTAASIFFVACIGVATGLGLPVLASLSALILHVLGSIVRRTHPEDEAPASKFLKVRIKADQLDALKAMLPTETRIKSFEKQGGEVEVVLVIKGRNWDRIDALIDQIAKEIDMSLMDVQSY
ncbi:MAG TPA: MgtC/SapB family protein [Oculatellaceae cyanobacterium]